MSVDLLILYRSAVSKDNAKQTGDDYSRLVQTLQNGGLQATGKKGEKRGELIIFVHCPEQKLTDLARVDATRAFVHGLTSSYGAIQNGINPSPAERSRLIHLYVCSSRKVGGLGITPGAPEWSRVESVILMHDQHYNDKWIKNWSISLDVDSSLDQLRAQFGESLAIYFAFLSFYTRSLVVPAALGIFAFFYLGAFSYLYSVALLLWSVIFVEWWRIKERKLSVKWGVRGASNVETLRAEYIPEGDLWWKRELKMVASFPVIVGYAILLIALMTSIFVFEAFVTLLYNGPGHQYIGFAPTVLFIVLVPRLLSFYRMHAAKLTEWENHPCKSDHDRSLVLKTFALAAIVAYGGLALSAFVYVPLGSQIMRIVQSYLSSPLSHSTLEATEVMGWFKTDKSGVQGESLIRSLRGMRLRDQVFAYTVTNQVINLVQEVIVPWAVEIFENVKARDKLTRKKRVAWEDEPIATRLNKEECELLDAARAEAALPDYHIFDDYSEMAMQFGYVVVWSTCWPLAPLMALINDWVELRSDAFKIAKLGRRPLPSRTDSIGAWLQVLSFITWLGALVNSALVTLFNPSTGAFASAHLNTTAFSEAVIEAHGNASAGADPAFSNFKQTLAEAFHGKGSNAILPAVVIALLASHGHIILCSVVRHILERALWLGSAEETMLDEHEREMREARVRDASLDGDGAFAPAAMAVAPLTMASDVFWVDHGLEEINNAAKLD